MGALPLRQQGTKSSGKSQNSMRVALVKTLSKGDMKPEMDLSSNQARLPWEGLEHQHSHKHFKPQFILSNRWAGIRKAKKS